MDLNLLLPLLVTVSVTIIGWFIANQLNSWRDRVNNRREQRIEYLIGAYRRLAKAIHNPHLHEVSDELESAVSDIQLFGNNDQIQKVIAFAKQIANNEEANLDELMNLLRNDLRRELRLSKAKETIWWLRMNPKDTVKSERKRR